MSNYNAVVKLHQEAVNSVLKDLHESLYPKYLKDKKDIIGLAEVSWDFKSPPFVNFTQANELKEPC